MDLESGVWWAFDWVLSGFHLGLCWLLIGFHLGYLNQSQRVSVGFVSGYHDEQNF